MSIAEKLTTIAENVPNVYKAGQDSQQSTIDNLQNQLDIANNLNSTLQKSWQTYHDEINEIRNEIRNLNVDVSGDIEPLSDAIPEVYEAGKKSQYDEFWDITQENGTRTDYNMAFCNSSWTKETFKPKYNIVCTSLERGFAQFNNRNKEFDLAEHLNELGVELETTGCKRYYYAFYLAKITHLPTIDLSDSTANNNAFATSYLQIIDKLIFGEKTATASLFADAKGLTTITEIEGEICDSVDFKWSPLLKNTIIRVINSLSETTANKTITFKKTAVNNAFGINVDDVTTYPEGSEFYNLRNSKSNWNFSYA